MSKEKTFEPYLNRLVEVFIGLPWEDKTVYASWLAQTYYFVNNSTRLIALAGACAKPNQQSLHYRFIQHANEEKAHEKLLINDLKHLGYSVKDLPEFPQTAGFYQAQYYWIQHVNPASFFGYVYALEGLAVKCGKDVHTRVLNAHGKQASSFLLVHSNEDIEHLKKAEKEIGNLSDEEFPLFIENLKVSTGLYEQLLHGCAQFAKKNQAA